MSYSFSLLRVVIVIATVAVSMAIVPHAAAADWLVHEGNGHATIVIAEQPSRMARLAASELQSYITKITGARLPIATEPDATSVAIYVGRSKHTAKLGLHDDDLQHGAYRIATGAQWLALLGSDKDFKPVAPYAERSTRGSSGRAERTRLDTEWEAIAGEPFSNPFHYVYAYWHEDLQVSELDDAGTLNAVNDYLRSLGVRWYYPGPLGEVVPTMASLPLPERNTIVRPDFAVRNISWWSRDVSMTRDEHLWNLRMGTNLGAEVVGLTQLCHGAKFVGLRQEYKEKYPDHFALINGKRNVDHKGGQGAPCLASEGFMRNHLKYARAIFDHYDEPMLSIDVPDGYGAVTCQCSGCTGKSTPDRGWSGSMSDYIFNYMNPVAGELLKTHPDKMVSALAYGAYLLPPETIDTLSPNLALWFCQSRKNVRGPDEQQELNALRKAWLEKLPSRQMFIYEYAMDSRPKSAWKHIPVFQPRRIAADLASLQGIASGEMIDCYQPHHRDALGYDYLAIKHLNLYITTRLWWDADSNVDMLLDEYYTNFYGPASQEMKAFIEFSEQNWQQMRRSVDAIDGALKLIAAAKAVAGDGVYGQRVAMVADYIAPLAQLRDKLAVGRENVPQARALPRSGKDLVIDGKLDEELWSTVRWGYQLKDLDTGERVTNPTSFRIAWIDGALCLGITCHETDMANMIVGTTKDDDPSIWNGDVVELLLETQYHSYYQIAISPSGAVVDLDREQGLQTLWDAGAEVATHRGEDRWTIEVRLPAAGENARDIDPLFGIAGDQPTETFLWYLNVCRQRLRGDHNEKSAWSPTGTGRFNVPEKFGKVYAR